MFIPLKIVLIGIDPYPFGSSQDCGGAFPQLISSDCLPALNSGTPPTSPNIYPAKVKNPSNTIGTLRNHHPALPGPSSQLLLLQLWPLWPWTPGDSPLMLGWFPHVPTTAGLNGEEERQEVADAETTWIRKELDMGHGGNGY
jgi:hypothetical protein